MSNSAIVVGGRECPISKIVATLKSGSVFSLFHDKWTSIARELDTPSEKIKKWRQDLLLDKIGLADLIQILIEEWVGRSYMSANSATLQEFNHALESNGLRNCADKLKQEFIGGKQEPVKKPSYKPTPRGKGMPVKNDINFRISKIEKNIISSIRVPKILNVLRRSKSFSLLYTKWIDIASALETPLDRVEKLKQDLKLDIIGLVDLLHSLLDEWVARNGSRATLVELIRIFESSGLGCYAEELRTELGEGRNKAGLTIQNNLGHNSKGDLTHSSYSSPGRNIDHDYNNNESWLLSLHLGNNISSQLQTPPSLHSAARHAQKNNGDNLEILKSLIDTGADVFAKDEENRTFLHILLEEGTTITPSQLNEMVTFLASRNYSTLFEITGWKTGAPPLQWAVLGMEVEESSLALLHSTGVDFNGVDNSGRNILFYWVAGQRSLKMFLNLVRFGVDFNHRDGENNSLLHIAAQLGSIQVLKFFLDLGINDVNYANNRGDTPLHQVVRFGKHSDDVCEKTRMLVENGANANVANNEGVSPLALAVGRKGSLEDLRRLFENLNINFG